MTFDDDLDVLVDLIQGAVDLDEPIGADTRLISSGLIESFDVVLIVTMLEERYGVQIPVEDISVETFDTPRLMFHWLEGSRP